MPAKKAAAKKIKPKARKAAAPSQFDSLRKTINDLRTRLEKELKARKIETRVLDEAKKARDQLSTQVKALRQQGTKLAADLKSALGDSKKFEKARLEAQKKAEQLKNELSEKTSELRRKSEELKKLAEESVHRAAEIIRGDGHETASAAPAPQAVDPGPASEPSAASPAEPGSGDKEPSV